MFKVLKVQYFQWHRPKRYLYSRKYFGDVSCMLPIITSDDGRLPEKSFQCSETSEKLSCFTGNPGKTFLRSGSYTH